MDQEERIRQLEFELRQVAIIINFMFESGAHLYINDNILELNKKLEELNKEFGVDNEKKTKNKTTKN